MIRLITGDFGSGKTTEIFSLIRADIACGREAILLVPEQETVSAEQAMAAQLSPAATLLFEVSNFSRLANTVFRRVGGLSYHYADLGTRTLCMWRTMGELLPLLHEKGGTLELGRVRRMTSAMRELSALSITPTQLQNAAKKLKEDASRLSEKLENAPRLSEKLEDLSLVSSLYHGILHEKYDDATEDLDRLYELLSRENPLAGTHIYIDGFTSFTEQQWRVLRALARTCPLTFTLALPRHRRDNPVFLECGETYARLVSELGLTPADCRDLGESRRATAPILRDVLGALFDGTPTPKKADKAAPVCPENGESAENAPENAPKSTPALRILAAENAMGECEWIASDITRRVMEEGAHYRDFAIIARHADSYDGVLDTVFAAAGIPLFFSKHTDISAYAAIKLIYTAYAVCTGGWRQGDVISFCKCGLSGIPQEDIDIFELYVTRWSIGGKRFTADEPWTMNPDGYQASFTPRAAAILSRAEGVRQKLLAQLIPLAETCRRASVREHARSLYRFLSSLDLEEKLRARAAEAKARGDKAESEETARLFSVICDALDRLVETVGDSVVDADTFVDLLRLLFGEVTLSRIPSSLDEVTVGSADIIRIGRAKHVYLIGANEGVFPAYASEESVFSDGDRRTLKELGLPLAPTLYSRAARELFCFARAFSAASESVSILYANKTLGGSSLRPASVLENIVARFSLPVTEIAELSVMDKLWTQGLSRDHLGILRGTEEGEALCAVMQADEILRRLDRPLVEAEDSLSAATAKRLFGDGISLSQTRIDHFARCPLSFLCQDILRLDPAKVIEFGNMDIGNLQHAMLEHVFRELDKDGKRIGELDDKELLSLLDRLLSDYVARILPAEHRCTARFGYLVRTLRRSLVPALRSLHEEFSQSEFYPTFFEWDIADAWRGEPFCRLPAGEDGREIPVRLSGRIDRVDTYQKDGETYFRVVDYKKNGKDFSLADFEEGRDVQLFLYLYSLWKGKGVPLSDALGGTTLRPAGMMFLASRASDLAYDAPQAPEKVEADAKKLKRSGLFLSDLGILRAMERDLGGRFIPIRLKNDGEFYDVSLANLASKEDFEHHCSTLERVVADTATAITSGKASAAPIKTGRNTACKYCDMAPVCRFAKE